MRGGDSFKVLRGGSDLPSVRKAREIPGSCRAGIIVIHLSNWALKARRINVAAILGFFCLGEPLPPHSETLPGCPCKRGLKTAQNSVG